MKSPITSDLHNPTNEKQMTNVRLNMHKIRIYYTSTPSRRIPHKVVRRGHLQAAATAAPQAWFIPLPNAIRSQLKALGPSLKTNNTVVGRRGDNCPPKWTCTFSINSIYWREIICHTRLETQTATAFGRGLQNQKATASSRRSKSGGLVGWSNIAWPTRPSIMRAMIYVIIIRRTFVVDVVVFGLYLDVVFLSPGPTRCSTDLLTAYSEANERHLLVESWEVVRARAEEEWCYNSFLHLNHVPAGFKRYQLLDRSLFA